MVYNVVTIQRVENYLLGLTLVGNSLEGLANSLLIGEVVVLDGLEVSVQLVNEGDASGDIQLGDFGFGDIVQIFDQSTDRVTVSSNDNALARLDSGSDVAEPEWNKTSNSILQRLGLGDLLGLETLIAAIMARIVLVGGFNLRRGDIVATTPNLDLNMILSRQKFAQGKFQTHHQERTK